MCNSHGRCWEDSGEQDKEGNCPCRDFSPSPRVLVILKANTKLCSCAGHPFKCFMGLLYVIFIVA